MPLTSVVKSSRILLSCVYYLCVIDNSKIKYLLKPITHSQDAIMLSGKSFFRGAMISAVAQITNSSSRHVYICFVIWSVEFPSVLWLLVGRQEGYPACKKLDVGLLVVMIWLELCMTYSSSSPVVTTTSIILCFSKHRLTQIHLENGR